MATRKKQAEAIAEEELVTDPVIEIPEPEEAAPEHPQFVIAGEGDSYAAIAARTAPAGVRAHDYAGELLNLNAGRPVRAGNRIRLY